jgi:hypothetical protein
MEKEFLPYQESLELKELGFDEPCFGYWGISEVHQTEGEITLETRQVSMTGNLAKKICLAPTFSQAFRWFRDKYGLFTSIIVDQTTKPKFYYNISEYYEDETTWEWKDGWGNSSLYRIYEEAELACLIKLIEIVKEKQ